MKIGSISIVVPTRGCINNCKFCVSRMHETNYKNKFDEFQIEKRIKWAVNNNVNNCIITGTGEALQNISFLYKLTKIFKKLNYPFPNVELQTSGILLSNGNYDKEVSNLILVSNNIEILNSLGVNTISLSVSDIFNDDNNMHVIGVPIGLRFKLKYLCSFIKEQNFNLRLSLNLNKTFDNISCNKLFLKLKELNADQITFRKLWYAKNEKLDQSKWVKENSCNDKKLNEIYEFIISNGTELYKLPFGAMAYSLMGMSVVIDNNCMSKNENEKLKYVILRENGKLYCQWDDEGSLIF